MKDFLLHNTNTFLSLLSKLKEGIVIHNQDTSILYANPAAAKILNMSEDELFGQTDKSHDWYFIDQNYKKLAIENFPVNKIFRTNQNIENELIGVYESQENIKWLNVNATITKNEKNEPLALIVLTDVSDKKRAYDEVELFKQLVDTVDIGITISDPSQKDNPLVYANKWFLDLTGYSHDEIIGKNCRFLQQDDTQQEAIKLFREAISKQEACEALVRNYKKDGALFYNLLNITPYFKDGTIKHFFGIQHDLTKQKKQQLLLEEQALYIQSILDAQTSLVFVLCDEKTVFTNHAFNAFFGFSSNEEFLQKNADIVEYFIKDDACFYLEKLQNQENWIEYLKNLDSNNAIVAMSNAEGVTRYFRVDIAQAPQSQYIITLNDITNTILKEKMLTNRAYHDKLTGVFNRQYFYEIFMHKAFDKDNIYGVIMFDIDNFKSLNDTYGHAVGDKVLKRTATALQDSLRSTDSIIRWGGEEFIVVVQVLDSSKIPKIAQVLRKAIEAIRIDDVRAFTASFGATVFEKDENIDTTIQRADMALYKAKENGKNRVEFISKVTIRD